MTNAEKQETKYAAAVNMIKKVQQTDFRGLKDKLKELDFTEQEKRVLHNNYRDPMDEYIEAFIHVANSEEYQKLHELGLGDDMLRDRVAEYTSESVARRLEKLMQQYPNLEEVRKFIDERKRDRLDIMEAFLYTCFREIDVNEEQLILTHQPVNLN